MRFRWLALPLLLVPAVALLAADPKSEPSRDLPDGTEAATKRIPQLKMPKGMKAELWAAEPKIQSPVAISVDEKGRVYAAEEYRLGKGATENRSNPAFDFSFFLEDDLQIQTLDDRLKVYEKWKNKVPGGPGYYTANPDQVRRLEDTTGSGRADQSTVFSGGYNKPLDGLMAGILARDGDVYVTNIPSLYKLKDTKGDGVADKKEELLTGFGVNIAFYGHDLHGLIIGPDGKLYFSVGDRGYNVTSKEGKRFVSPRSGGVFRCNRDGTDFEVVHHGLRNPQELAFDDHGNLFAGDNNCDKGDHGRLVYCIDGGETGWNMAYQTIPEPYLTGPWHAERLWHEPHAGQPAYITPCIGKIGTGPSGLLFTNGTSLDDRYKNSFLLCNYTGNGGLESFKLKEKGAGFQIDDYHDFLKPISATDAEFGPDGKLYVADFVNLNWDGRSAGGRIYTVFDPEKLQRPAVVETQKLFAEGFDQRKPEELAKLLGHADQRIRQKAQFALVKKGALEELKKSAKVGDTVYARLHGIWGLGQLAKSKSDDVTAPLISMLFEQEPEVRAQAAKVLGECRIDKAAPDLKNLLADKAPRVQFFAAQALGQLKFKIAIPEIFAVLQATGETDPWLRDACVIALCRTGDGDALAEKATDKSANVRMGAVLALRKMSDKRLSLFLNDSELPIRTEAARAIHDLPIESEYPALAAAKYADVPLVDGDAFVRRIIDANFRLGAEANAKAILGIALDPNTSVAVRSEALGALKDWAKPSQRDRVTGFWRPLKERDAGIARRVVEAGLTELLAKTTGKLQIDAVALISALGVNADEKLFAVWIADKEKDVNLRGAALRFLADKKSHYFAQSLAVARADASPLLRAEARDILVTANPAEAATSILEVINKPLAPLAERQRAMAALAKLKDPNAVAALDEFAESLAVKKNVPADFIVDIWDALKVAPSAKRDPLRKKFEDSLAKDPVGKFQPSLTGGDAVRGREVFFNHSGAQCVRCHKVEGIGGVAGPELTKLVQRHPEKTREFILESLVLPSAQIAQGFASVTLNLIDGRTVAGVVQKEDPKSLTLLPPDGKAIVIPAEDIEKRTKPESAMPSVEKVLSPREMRDVIEYLNTLK